MKDIRQIDPGELNWVRPSARERAFALKAGRETIASLRWDSPLGSRTEAVAADGTWTFKRVGFFGPRVTVRKPNSENDLATFTPNWKSEGVLVFSNGPTFHWGSLGFSRASWVFTNASGGQLVEFAPQQSFLKKGAVVTVTAAGRQVPELSLLVLLGWYVMILRSDDDAAASAAVCITAAS